MRMRIGDAMPRVLTIRLHVREQRQILNFYLKQLFSNIQNK